MKEIVKQRFLDHLQVANAVMNSDILAQIERIAVEVKKALADGSSPQVWLLPAFTIIRPKP